jgi:two-component system alkaline phosphatase synthesis response regulator PhoP
MQAELLVKPLRQRPTVKQQHSVLIIDDDEAMAEVLSTRLASQGFRTLTANQGQLGLEIAKQKRPDLILLDLRLPDRDGFDVCAELDDSSETTGIPIIILSGMARPDVIRKSRAAGCRYYVRKPYDPNALLLLIQQALRE